MRLCWAVILVGAGLGWGAGWAAGQAVNGPETVRPADAIFVEAESLVSDPPGAWQVEEYGKFSHWRMFGYPSQLKWLKGSETGPGGSARTSVTIAKAGRYRIWIRNLDQPAGVFTVSVRQNGRTVGAGEFNAQTERRPEDSGGWSFGHQLFAWWSVEAALEAGPCELELTRGAAFADGNAFVVDCFAFTTDANYRPHIRDWSPPLYIRVRMGPRHNALGGGMYFWGRIDFAPFFTGSDFINKGGLFHTTGFNGLTSDTFLHAGDVTPWMDIAPYLDQRPWNRMRFDMLSGWPVYLPDSEFTIEMTRDPAEPPFKQFHRSGKGSGMVLMINLLEPEKTYSSIEGSAEHLERARAAPVPRWGKQPRRFPLLTGLSMVDAYDPEEAMRNDLLALREMGLTGSDVVYDPEWLVAQGFSYTQLQKFTFHLVKQAGCLSQPNLEAMDRELGEQIARYWTARPQMLFIRVMDECYSVTPEHLTECAACAEKFRGWLKAQGIDPRELAPDLVVKPGEDPWAQIAPRLDKSQRKLYYYTVRFRSRILTDFFKTVTAVVQRHQPALRTASNTSLELTFAKNMLDRGVDLFEVYGENALTHGHAEDANSFPPSGQTGTYIMDTLRAACKANGQPFGTYIISTCPGWDITARAVAAVGHGAKFLHYYDYGPYHAASSDPQSQRPDFIPAVKEANYIIGHAEDDLMDAQPVSTPVALLVARSTDVWTDTKDMDYVSNSGTERVYLYLLLRHLGYPVDILTEDDVLAGRAEAYRAIFMTESHLADGVLPRLLDWVKRGGFLYAGAGSARFNQFHEPLTGLEELGLRRESFVFRGTPGYWPYHLGVETAVQFNGREVEGAGGYQKLAADTAGEVKLRFADGSPCAVEIPHGRGRVVYVGFFPATTYVRAASIPLLKEQEELRASGQPYRTFGSTHYPGEYRELVRSLLTPLDYTPPVRVSDPLVEGCLMAGKKQHVLLLANWSGTLQTVTVSVDLPYRAGAPRPAANPVRDLRRSGRTLTFTLDVGPAEAIVFPRARD